MGVIPGGRGNDLARVLGIPDDPIRPARWSRPGALARSTSGSWTTGRSPEGVRRHRLGGLRQRRQPDRQRGALVAGRVRLRLRSAAGAAGLEAGPLRAGARPAGREARSHRLHRRGRQLPVLRRRHARRPRRPPGRRHARCVVLENVSKLALPRPACPKVFKGDARDDSRACTASAPRDLDQLRAAIRRCTPTVTRSDGCRSACARSRRDPRARAPGRRRLPRALAEPAAAHRERAPRRAADRRPSAPSSPWPGRRGALPARGGGATSLPGRS